MTTTQPQGPTCTPGGFGIDPRLGAAALRAPAASLSNPQIPASQKLQLQGPLRVPAKMICLY